MGVYQSLKITQVRRIPSKNKSEVSIIWQSTQSGSSYNNDGGQTAYYWISYNGGAETKYSVSGYKLSKNKTVTILSKTIEVPHRTDGTGSIKVRTSMNTKISAGTITQSKTATLVKIPRNATIASATNITLGQAPTIKWTPNDSTHKFKIRFQIGNYDTGYGSGTSNGSGFTTDAFIQPKSTSAYTYSGFKFPISVANQITTSTTGKIKISLATYNSSGVQVGGVSTFNITATVPNSLIPTIGKVTTSIDHSSLNGNTALKAKFDKLGIYIVGYSKMGINVAGSSGSYGSTVTSYEIIGENDQKVTATTASSLNFVSEVLSLSGEQKVTVRAIDSRGRFSQYYTINYTAYEYSKPVIGSIIKRVEDSQKKVTVFATCTYSSLNNKNSITSAIAKYKKTNTTNWLGTIALSKNPLYNKQGEDGRNSCMYLALSDEVFEIGATYEFEITISDQLYEVSDASGGISTEYVLLDFKDGGKGLGIGKRCEIEGLEIALPMQISEGVIPITLGSGTNLYNINKSGIYVSDDLGAMKDQVSSEDVASSPTKKWSTKKPFILEIIPIGESNILQKIIVFDIIDDSLDKPSIYVYYRLKYGGSNTSKGCTGWIFQGTDRTIGLIPESNFQIERYYCSRQGDIVNIYARMIVKTTQVNQGAGVAVASLSDVSLYPAMAVATMGIASTNGACAVWYSASNKKINIRPYINLPKSSAFEFNLTWDINAEWKTS